MSKTIHLFDLNTFSRKFSNYMALGLSGLLIWFGAEWISNWKENRRLEREVQVRRNESIQRVDQEINDWNVDTALSIITDLKDDRTYTPGELSGMEAKVRRITDDGLYSRIQSSPIDGRITLSEQYLNAYPNGKHRKEAIEDLLISRSYVLSKSLQATQEFNQTYLQLKNLTSALEEYSHDEIDFSVIPLDKLSEQGGNIWKIKKKSRRG